jgi:hypothetical protein
LIHEEGEEANSEIPEWGSIVPETEEGDEDGARSFENFEV